MRCLLFLVFFSLLGCSPRSISSSEASSVQRLLLGDSRMVFPKGSTAVGQIAIGPPGTPLMAVSHMREDLSVVNLETSQVLWTLPLHENDGILRSLSFSPDGRTLMEHHQFFVIFRNVADGNELRRVAGGSISNGFKAGIFTPDGKSALLSRGPLGPDRGLFLADLESLAEKFLQAQPLWGNWVESLQVTSDQRFAAGVMDSIGLNVVFWNLVTGNIERRVSMETGETASRRTPIALSRDLRFAALAFAGRVQIYDLEAEVRVRDWRVAPAAVGFWTVRFTYDGCCVVVSGEDRVVHLWRLSDGQEIASLDGRFEERSVKFSDVILSSERSLLFVGAWDGAVYEWSIEQGEGPPK